MWAILSLSVIAAAVLAALCGKVLVETRQDVQQQADVSAANLARTIDREAARTFEIYDLSIQRTIAALAQPEFPALSRDIQHLILFDRAAVASYLQNVFVTDEYGKVTWALREHTPQTYDLSNRSFFQFHRDSAEAGLHVGDLIMGRSSGVQVLTLSRRITKPDGSFGGVVAGALGVDYFEALFASLQLGTKGTMTLFRVDGTIVVRYPSDRPAVGKKLPNVALFQHVAESRSGRYEAQSLDGVQRTYTYSRIGNLPLVVNIGIASADISARWWPRAWKLAALMLFLAIVVMLLAFLLFRELAARQRAETQLVKAAMSDPLTGVANRRAFNQELSRAWDQSRAMGESLSMLMIDVDRFKHYNDAFGHIQGDYALRAVAETIEGCCRRNDLVARFGGEEFAVILREADVSAAFDVAERIRQAVARADIPDQYGFDRPVTISIGVAEMATNDDSIAAMIMRADDALYRAKGDGRNATRCATFGPAEASRFSAAAETAEVRRAAL